MKQTNAVDSPGIYTTESKGCLTTQRVTTVSNGFDHFDTKRRQRSTKSQTQNQVVSKNQINT